MEPKPLKSAMLAEEYMALAHAMQTGVKFDQESGSTDGTPKHLRVGVNSCMVNNDAVARLLMEKGVFTQEEYIQAVVDAMRREVERYEELLTERYGKPIKLG